MQILITGAGMVGCHAARVLVEAGHAVTLYEVEPRRGYIAQVAGPDVALRQGDIRELPLLLRAVQECRAEVLVHTAALIGGAAQAEPFRGFEVNIVGAMNVLEAARLGEVRRIVHSSTLGTHDLAHPQTGPLTESFPLGSGGRVYGASKVAAEQVFRTGATAYGLELAMLRFAGIYGYGHFAGGSGIGTEIDSWLRAGLAGRPAVNRGGIRGAYEVVHAKDTAAAVLAAVTAATLPHDTYNVGSEALIDPEKVEAALARIFPGFRVEGGGPGRPEQFPRLFPFDLTRSRAELGYAPRFDIDAGLRDLAEELRGAPAPA